MNNVNTVLLAIIQNVQCKYCTTGNHTECTMYILYYWQSYRMHNVNTVLLAIIQNAECKYCTTGNHTECIM